LEVELDLWLQKLIAYSHRWGFRFSDQFDQEIDVLERGGKK